MIKSCFYQEYCNWVAELPIGMKIDYAMTDVIMAKIAEKDGKTFFLSDDVIYGRKEFESFPTMDEIKSATSQLRKQLEKKAQKVMQVKEAIDILEEVL